MIDAVLIKAEVQLNPRGISIATQRQNHNLQGLRTGVRFHGKRTRLVIPMNLKDANHAVKHAKMKAAEETEDSARCLTLSVRRAGKDARFLSSPDQTAPYIAVTVFLTEDKQKFKEDSFRCILFLLPLDKLSL